MFFSNLLNMFSSWFSRGSDDNSPELSGEELQQFADMGDDNENYEGEDFDALSDEDESEDDKSEDESKDDADSEDKLESADDEADDSDSTKVEELVEPEEINEENAGEYEWIFGEDELKIWETDEEPEDEEVSDEEMSDEGMKDDADDDAENDAEDDSASDEAEEEFDEDEFSKVIICPPDFEGLSPEEIEELMKETENLFENGLDGEFKISDLVQGDDAGNEGDLKDDLFVMADIDKDFDWDKFLESIENKESFIDEGNFDEEDETDEDEADWDWNWG